MLVKIPEDHWLIVQKSADGHVYAVNGGRLYSHQAEADKVYKGLVTKFDQMVAAGATGAWRPELRAVKYV